MKPPWFQVFLALLAVFPASAQQPGAADDEAPEAAVVDRIVAVVDEDPILESDMARVIGLSLVRQDPEEPEATFRRRVLDELIDERLRFHEIDRFGFAKVSPVAVEQAIAEIRERFASAKAFEERLGELGLSAEEVGQLVARQLMVLTYVDERLGPRVFVGRESIQRYYDEVLVPELQSRREPVPEIGEVREQIRAVLREQRLNEELERWTAELRSEADIEDYSDDFPVEVPPLVVGSEKTADD